MKNEIIAWALLSILGIGEYGKHIDEATEKVDPVIKENLTVDRERLRRELSEKIMVAMIRELAGKSPHSTSSNITVFEAMAGIDRSGLV
jgi:hypothetical protein